MEEGSSQWTWQTIRYQSWAKTSILQHWKLENELEKKKVALNIRIHN
jgi:hypothetical protein